MHRATQAYFNTQASTTSPGKVVVMLYDGGISFLERAKLKIDEKNYAEKGILISKAIDVIHELTSSLNVEKGGNLAENLTSLYFYCTTTLLQANMKMDKEKIDIVINILSGLRGAFEEILDKPEAIMAAQQNAMTMRAVAPQNRPLPEINSAPLGSFNSAKVSNLYARSNQSFAGAKNENTLQREQPEAENKAEPKAMADLQSKEKQKLEENPEQNQAIKEQNSKKSPEQNQVVKGRNLKEDLKEENINLESKNLAQPKKLPDENDSSADNITTNSEQENANKNADFKQNMNSFTSFKHNSQLYQRLLQK